MLCSRKVVNHFHKKTSFFMDVKDRLGEETTFKAFGNTNNIPRYEINLLFNILLFYLLKAATPLEASKDSLRNLGWDKSTLHFNFYLSLERVGYPS